MSKTFLITGANRGIGLEMTRQAAMNGDRVIACARNIKEASDLVALKKQNEATVKEISKGKARKYIGYAARDVFNLGKRDQAASDIGRLGGKHPDQDYQKGPERKAAKRVGGIDRATKILMKKDRKEATTSDAERKTRTG